ncbi:MAG: glutamate ABC transporter substrate-binding protein [Lactobacillaceae bacterium]|nr:glutamate ABC transporter substrate-binding protein [Lactobacillaceae bacterium]
MVGLLSASLVGPLLVAPAYAATTKKDTVIKRIKKTDKMTWGVKADTRLMGLMNVENGKIEGLDIDMAKAITKRIDPKAKPVFVQVTSGTRIPLLINGNIDAVIATMSITPERAKIVDFSNKYFKAGQSLLVVKSSKIKNIEDTNHKGVTVIGVAGSTSVENFAKLAPNAKVLALPDYATALTALKAGQGDALTTDNGILAGMAAEDHTLKVVGGTFTNEPYGIAFAKGNPKLVKATNKAIKDMKKDGSYEKIIKKWFGTVPGMNWKELAK